MDARDYRPQQRPAGEEEEEAESEFKPSKMGEPYNYPLPKSKEDPWMTLLKPLQEKDAGRCKAWREEVENLLIFAGLFSAVVTAFFVEFYKTLQPDSNDQSVVLLIRILSQLESGGTVNTSTTTILPNFSPMPSNIRINVLWFLSLVLSLATVLVGIVSLQWLREHQRPRPDIPPQLAYSLFHMHAESIERWYLPQIFTMLPLLLQSGLIFFLVGIIEFLWHLNCSAAIPVIVVIGLILCFLALTTTLPSLQAISLFLPRFPWNKAPRVQCAYMSPQSWAFHRSVAPFINVIMRLFSVWIDKWRIITPDTVVNPNFFPIRSATAIIFRLAKEDSWLDHGISWMYQRDLDFASLVPTLNSHFVARLPPMFDANQALSAAMRSTSPKTDDEILAEENCIQQFADLVESSGDYFAKLYFEYLHQLYSRNPPLSNNLAVQQASFLFVCGHLNRPGRILMPSLRRHKLELLLRLLEWGSMPTEQEFVSLLGLRFMVQHYKYDWDHPDIEGLGIQQSLQGILQKIFNNLDVFDPRNAPLHHLEQGLSLSLSEIGYYPVMLFSETMITSITSRLRSALEPDPLSTQLVPTPDFLFYTSVSYLTPFLRDDASVTISDSLCILTATLLEYHARMGRTLELERLIQFNHNSDWLDSWGFVELAKKCGIVYPQPTSSTITPETQIPLLSADAPNAAVNKTQTLATAPPTIPFAEDCDSDVPNHPPDKSQPAPSTPTTATANSNLQILPPTNGVDDWHTGQTDAAHPHTSLDNSIFQDAAAERTPPKTHVHIDMDKL